MLGLSAEVLCLWGLGFGALELQGVLRLGDGCEVFRCFGLSKVFGCRVLVLGGGILGFGV